MAKRTLYDCFEAKVFGESISCAKGHILSGRSYDGNVNIRQLKIGRPLGLTICQGCGDFESMGSPVPAKERGWLSIEIARSKMAMTAR